MDGDLIDLYARRERGDKVDLPIYNTEEQKRRYENALVELRSAIAQERSLTMGMPRFVGAVRVVPAPTDPAMQEDPAIELIGMKETMAYVWTYGPIRTLGPFTRQAGLILTEACEDALHGGATP